MAIDGHQVDVAIVVILSRAKNAAGRPPGVKARLKCGYNAECYQAHVNKKLSAAKLFASYTKFARCTSDRGYRVTGI